MASERWSYQVVQVKPGFLGMPRQAVQDRLNDLGRQGWELVSAVQNHWMQPVQLFLKKPLP